MHFYYERLFFWCQVFWSGTDMWKFWFFRWFLLIKTIETCFDHKEPKSAIRSILQISPPLEFQPLEEKRGPCKRSGHSGSSCVLVLVLVLFKRVVLLIILIIPSFGKRGLRCATGRWKACLFAESCNSWGCTVNRRSSCGRRFLQNLRIRRFRKVMIKTSFHVFL